MWPICSCPRGMTNRRCIAAWWNWLTRACSARLDAGDHAWRFEMRGEEHATGEHPHFVCVDCGQVTCLPDVEVKIASTKGTKAVGVGNVTEVFLKGHCKQCQD